jgi:hypothetical protein
MLKKLVIAAVAVVVGMAVLHSTRLGSHVKVWWQEAKAVVERQVPPEQRLKVLQVEIDKIDKEIRNNISKIAERQVNCDSLEKDVVALRGTVNGNREEVADLAKALDAKVEFVNFNGESFNRKAATHKLDLAVSTFKARKNELERKEQLLAERKKGLDIANQRITEMKAQRDQLTATVAELQTRIEMARLNHMADKLDIDDSQVGRCNALVKEIEQSLDRQTKEADLLKKYGYTNEAPAEKATRSTEDVLNSAKEVLQDNGQRVVNK